MSEAEMLDPNDNPVRATLALSQAEIIEREREKSMLLGGMTIPTRAELAGLPRARRIGSGGRAEGDYPDQAAQREAAPRTEDEAREERAAPKDIVYLDTLVDDDPIQVAVRWVTMAKHDLKQAQKDLVAAKKSLTKALRKAGA